MSYSSAIEQKMNSDDAPSHVLNRYVHSVSEPNAFTHSGVDPITDERVELASLTVEEVSEWLGIVRCSAFAVPFAEAEINGRALERLTDMKLKAMNVGTPVQRKKLLKYIRQASRRTVDVMGDSRSDLLSPTTQPVLSLTTTTGTTTTTPTPNAKKTRSQSRLPAPSSTPRYDERALLNSSKRFDEATNEFKAKDKELQRKMNALLAQSDPGRSMAGSRASPMWAPASNVAEKVDFAATERRNQLLEQKLAALHETLSHHPNEPTSDDNVNGLNRRLLMANQSNANLQRRLRSTDLQLANARHNTQRLRTSLDQEQRDKDHLEQEFANFAYRAESLASYDNLTDENQALEEENVDLKSKLEQSEREKEKLHEATTRQLQLRQVDDGAPRTLEVHGAIYVRADLQPDDAAMNLREMTKKAWIVASKRLSEADMAWRKHTKQTCE